MGTNTNKGSVMLAAPTLFGRPMTIFQKPQNYTVLPYNAKWDSAERLLDLGSCRCPSPELADFCNFKLI
jgi:hypothetical protein